jgi:TonB family protein
MLGPGMIAVGPMSRRGRLMTFKHWIVIVVLSLEGAAAIASGQESLGSVTGVVSVASGTVIPNATLYITNTQTKAQRRVQTDITGRYEVLQLPPGHYRVTSETSGIRTSELTLGPGQRVEHDIAIEMPSIAFTAIVWDDEGPGSFLPGPSSTGITGGFIPGELRDVTLTTAEREDLTRWQRDQPVVAPRAVHMPRPVYPETMRELKREGNVVLEGTLSSDGFVSGLPDVATQRDPFVIAALEAVRSWQWEPARVNGGLVEVPFTATLHFRLAQNRPPRLSPP